MELPVLILAKQRDPDAGQCVGLEDLQSLVEGVVDVNLSTGTSNNDTTGPMLSALCSSCRAIYSRSFWQRVALIDGNGNVLANLLLVFFLGVLDGLFHDVIVGLPRGDLELVLAEGIGAL